MQKRLGPVGKLVHGLLGQQVRSGGIGMGVIYRVFDTGVEYSVSMVSSWVSMAWEGPV